MTEAQELASIINSTPAPFRIILLDGGRFTVLREEDGYSVTGITSEGRHTVGGEGRVLIASPIRVMDPQGVSERVEIALYERIGMRAHVGFRVSIDPDSVQRIASERLAFFPPHNPRRDPHNRMP